MNKRAFGVIGVGAALVLTACQPEPPKSDLIELVIESSPNLTEIKITGTPREDARWIRVQGTAVTRLDVFESLNAQDIAERCGVDTRRVRRAQQMGPLDTQSLVTLDLPAGTAVTFDIGMAPDRAADTDPPEEITQNGWTNGAWDQNIYMDGARISVFRTREWYGQTVPVAIESEAGSALCADLRTDG